MAASGIVTGGLIQPPAARQMRIGRRGGDGFAGAERAGDQRRSEQMRPKWR